MAFERNAVYRDANGRTFRILWGHGNEEMLWVIDTKNPLVWPEIIGRSYLVEAMVAGEVHLVEDAQLRSLPGDNNITDAERLVRDEAWNRLENLVIKEPKIYTRGGRAELVAQACKKYGGTRQTYYKNLRRFWQWGNVPNALVPEYSKCGGKGKRKELGDKKLGRPRSMTPGNGINIDINILKKIRVAASRKYLCSRKSKKRTAYNWMLPNCFPDDVIVTRSKKGRVKVEIINHNCVPTFEQFCYHFHRENSLSAIQLRRKGRRMFEKKMRPLLNSSLNEVCGPGSRYQIDATVIDVYVVSRFDRNRIVGRPTLYLVSDVFSRMIVGCYVGLESPSWFCATLALLNVVEDKVSFCARYGIEIEAHEWPVSELPLKLLGDRGEMESILADRLVTAFGIELENTPPYRGDAKGVVERTFRTVHETFGPYVPGYIDKDYKERGGTDYRLDAKLTVEDITGVIIRSILIINGTPRREYQALPEAVKDNISYAPIELWEWGKNNLRSDMRPFQYEYTRLHLLPDAKLKVTSKGLKYMKGLYYSSVDMMAEPWYLNAQIKGEELRATYHPGDMSRIYIQSPYDRTVSYVAELAPHCQVFEGKSLVEIDALRHRERKIVAENKADNTAKRIGFELEIEELVSKAIASAIEDYDPTLSAAERTRDIKKNKADEVKACIHEQIRNLGLGEDETTQLLNARVERLDADDVSENRFIEQQRERKNTE